MAARIATRLATLGTGPGGKMPPSTAGEDACRYLVAVPRCAREKRRGEKAFDFARSYRWPHAIIRMDQRLLLKHVQLGLVALAAAG